MVAAGSDRQADRKTARMPSGLWIMGILPESWYMRIAIVK